MFSEGDLSEAREERSILVLPLELRSDPSGFSIVASLSSFATYKWTTSSSFDFNIKELFFVPSFS